MLHGLRGCDRYETVLSVFLVSLTLKATGMLFYAAYRSERNASGSMSGMLNCGVCRSRLTANDRTVAALPQMPQAAEQCLLQRLATPSICGGTVRVLPTGFPKAGGSNPPCDTKSHVQYKAARAIQSRPYDMNSRVC